MYLFPTKEEIDSLWSELDPKQRFLRAAWQAVDCACSPDGDSMAAFFLDSQDFDIREEEGMRVYPRGLRAKTGAIDDYSGIDLGEKVSWEEI